MLFSLWRSSAEMRAWLTDLRFSGGVICVGGPAFTYYLTPTEEELFKKYNPDLQKKSLERRAERQQEFDDFVTKLKEYSKSDKPSTSFSSPSLPSSWPRIRRPILTHACSMGGASGGGGGGEAAQAAAGSQESRGGEDPQGDVAARDGIAAGPKQVSPSWAT